MGTSGDAARTPVSAMSRSPSRRAPARSIHPARAARSTDGRTTFSHTDRSGKMACDFRSSGSSTSPAAFAAAGLEGR